MKFRGEHLFVVGGLLCGLVLRLWGIWWLDLSHFDEGVYALWASGVPYPGREFFAPPLFPAWLSLWAGLQPGNDTLLLVGAAVAGFVGFVAAVVAAWMLYGVPAAGIVAALGAVSGWHVAFSRAVLTDALFSLWWVCGVALTGHWVRTIRDRGTVLTWHVWALAGVLTAAVYTKYHGWLLFVLMSAVGGGRLWCARSTLVMKFIGALIVVFGAGAVAYLPWAFHVEQTVGYTNLLQHHRGYLEGLVAWPRNLSEYATFSAWLSWWAEPALYVTLAGWLAWQARWKLAGLAVVLAVGAACWGELAVVLVTLLLLLVAHRQDPADVSLSLGMASLLLLGPIYRPYARLALPAVAVAWIAAARLLVGEKENNGSWKWAVVVGFILGTWWLVERPLSDPLPQVPDGALSANWNGFERGLQAELSGAGVQVAFLRPCVLYYLGNLDGPVPQVVGTTTAVQAALDNGAVVLVDGALALDDPELAAALRQGSYVVQKRIPYRPSDITLLDDLRNVMGSSRWPYELLVLSSKR